MIFVTVGTHEQPFDRLLKWIDKMVKEGKIKESVIIQKGYTDYEPTHCESHKLIGYDDMQNYIEQARIVITHGGPASFIAPISIGKIPIVVPRKKEFNEHVNDHQVEFSKEVEKRMNNIIVVENEEEIYDAIEHYEDKVSKMTREISSNNIAFNEKLEKAVEEMFKGRK